MWRRTALVVGSAILLASPGVAEVLTSGVPQSFSVGPVDQPTLLTADALYEINVPPQARRLEISLVTTTPGVDMNLLVRYGSRPQATGGQVVTDFGTAGYSGYETLTITTVSNPALQAGVYYIALALHTTGVGVTGTLTATFSADDYRGKTLAPGVPSSFRLPSVSAGTLFTGPRTYRIDVPAGATRLEVAVNTVIPGSSADVDLFVRHGAEPVVADGFPVADHQSAGPAGTETVVVTGSSTPPLAAGTYYVALALHTLGAEVEGLITAAITQGSTPPPAQPVLEVSPTSLTFSATTGANPPAQSIAVRNSGGGTLSYTVAADQSWLGVSPTSGTSTGESDAITVTADTNGLAAGTHTGRIVVSGAAGALATVSVTLVLTGGGPPPPAGPPLISDGGVVNAADYTPNFAPGMIISVFGANLAPGTTSAESVPLPTSLDGVSVDIIDGGRVLPAPLFFVSPGQINAQLLYALNSSAVQVRVRTAAGVSNAVGINVRPSSPRLFTKTLDGLGEAIVLHADYTMVSPESPAAPGEIVILYLSGLGAVSPSIQAGQPAGDGGAGGPLNLVNREDVSVRVAGMETVVHFAGLAPSWVGLYQINFQMPQEPPFGMLDIEAQIAGMTSQSEVGMASGVAWQTLVTKTVGSGGGSVSEGGTEVTIAPGALDSTANITIRKTTELNDAAEFQLSDVYSISGLPETTSGEITISAETTRPVPPGDVYLVLQERGEGSPASYVKARVVGSRLVATLPPRQTGSDGITAARPPRASRSATFLDFIVYRFVGSYFDRKTQTGRFLISAPARIATDAIAEALEDALTALVNFGFAEEVPGGSPIEVYLMPGNRWLVGWEPWGGIGWSWTRAPYIGINLHLLDGPVERIRPKVAHLVCHYIQDLYDPRSPFEKWYETDPWLWMNEAVATWFERWRRPGLASSNPAPIPQEALDNYDFLTKNGLEYPIRRGFLRSLRRERQHGYGASMFIEFLADVYFGDGRLLANLYALRLIPSAPAGGWLPVEALNKILEDHLSDRLADAWGLFCDSYLNGDLPFSNLPADWTARLMRLAQQGRFATRDQKTVRFDWDAPDLSARFHHITFADAWSTANDDQELVVRAQSTGGHEGLVAVYPISYGELDTEETIGSFNSEDTIPNVGSSYAHETEMLVLMANSRAVKPYDQISRVTLTLEVRKPATPAPEWLSGLNKVGANIAAAKHCTQAGEPIGCRVASAVANYNLADRISLAWNGLEFSASGTIPGSATTIAISGTLSADLREIEHAEFERNTSETYGDIHVKFTLSNIPLRMEPPTRLGPLNYGVDGEDLRANPSRYVSDVIDTYTPKDGSPAIVGALDYSEWTANPAILVRFEIGAN